ncbi:MAG: PHB depolymerase family esterase [Caldimonas sp.]
MISPCLGLRCGVAVLLATALAARAETVDRQVTVGTMQRHYEADLPNPQALSRPLPVVIVFHGGGGSAASARRQTGMSDKGRDEAFIVVYPQGSGPLRGRLLTWNAVTCCGPAMKQRIDEMAFVSAVLDDLPAFADIDRRRVYATGLSNGGMMAYRVACELADRNLPYGGGVGSGAIVPHEVRSVAVAVDFWRAHDGCSGQGELTQSPGLTRLRHAPCAGGSEVELVTIEGGGHSWPGGERLSNSLDAPSPALNATDDIWRFFSRH